MEDNIGFRAWFSHENGTIYSVLFKGNQDIELVATLCKNEEDNYNVKCFKIELWERDEEET